MKTIFSIIKYELKERLFNWMSLIFFLMMVFQGVWYTKGTFDYYVNDAILMNAPAIFYRNFAGTGMLMVIIITIVTGGVLYKDLQYKTASWIYTTPINEKHFFVGRFIAAFLYLIFISLGYFVGMLLVPYSGIGEAHRFGPAPLGQMIHGMLVFIVPNLLLFTSVIFSTLVITKRMAVTYLSSFVIIVIFLLMESSSSDGKATLFHLLGDPMGYVTVGHYFDFLTTAQKNTGYLSVSGFVLYNRLIWLVVSIVLFIIAYNKFSFKNFIQGAKDKSKNIKVDVTKTVTFVDQLPKVSQNFSTIALVNKTFRLSKLEFLNIVRPVSFKIITGILMLMVVMQNLMWNATYYIGPEVPLASNMTFFRLAWGVFIAMTLMIWAGELFFKDKTVNIWQITDATPQPIWVTLTARLAASIGLALLLCLCFVAIGICCQLLMGADMTMLDLKQYAMDLLGYRWGWLNFSLFICFVFFVGGITGNRFITHIFSIGCFILFIISFDMGLFEQVRYGYGFTPGVEDYSEVSGYGIYKIAANWIFLLWTVLAIVLVLFGIWFWDRGTGKKMVKKLSFSNKQLHWSGKIAIVVLLLVFIGLQFYIGEQAYNNGNFESSTEKEISRANYEKKYGYLGGIAHPKYQNINLNIDYFPEERKVIFETDILLKSTTKCDTLFLNFDDFVTVESISAHDQKLQLLKEDSDHNVQAYAMPEVDSTGAVSIHLKAKKQYIGFSQSDIQEDITFNGSFGSVNKFLPVIGYDYKKELKKNRERENQGLSKLISRKAKINDNFSLRQDFYSPNADWVTGDVKISTSEGQLPIAPGTLIKEWKDDEKRIHHHYRIDKPAPFNWYLGSSRFEVVKANIGENVVNVFADPKHPFNVQMYQSIITKSLMFLSRNLDGSYPYNELRLIEINRWNEEGFYAFPNVLAITEKQGWLADTSGLEEKAYLYQTIASNMAKHWVQTGIKVANVQGAEMLTVALPEAIGLQFVRQELGKEAAGLLLEKKENRYKKNRNNEPNNEPPLIYADGADYLEINKGTLALYALAEDIGFERFNTEVVQWFNESGNKPAVFIDLYKTLLAQISPDKKDDMKTFFETSK